MLDLLIKNGKIIDGTGSPGFYGAVGVEGDIVRIFKGDLSNVEAEKTIDAKNHIVCPGFIDVHAHSDLVILAEPRHEPKVRQGVTTELIGVDGLSYAPFRHDDDLAKFVELNSGIAGNPPLSGRWSTVEEYLDLFHNRVAVNIAYILGSSPMRINTIGWENRPAAPKDIENMKAIIREAMQEGAFGMSTGLDYPPGSYADTDELVALCKQVAAVGGIYHTHVRYKLGDRYLDPFKEALEIGQRSGVPVHITHLCQRMNTPGSDRLLELIETAYDAAQDVTFDSIPLYPASSRLLILLPEWTHDGGLEKLKGVLGDSEARKRLRGEMVPSFGRSWQDMWVTNFARPENKGYENCSLSEVAIMRGQHPVDAICDLLLAEDLQLTYKSALANLKTLPKFIAHSLSMVASDALMIGDYPAPRTYGAFPSILADYARDDKLMSLPTAIRKMTSFPAQRLGIPDRGILRDGFKADIAIFHPEEVGTEATRNKPKQFPKGIPYVIVNGSVVIDRGSHTGATPGCALKHGRSSG
jgi:N-acyl-D-amino-acid deacylase